jgi:hypothetical protein
MPNVVCMKRHDTHTTTHVPQHTASDCAGKHNPRAFISFIEY